MAPAVDEVHYEPWRPEEITLDRSVREYLGSFSAQFEVQNGASLPEFLNDEFDAFAEYGGLAHGFVRLR